jgi:pimeloyl-ACP methyl ester carboxylesterase
VLPDLAQTYRVYAPDLPGFGDSAKPDADYSPAFFTRFVGSFLDTLEIEHTTMIGNSLGGLVALRLALSDQSRITALVLVDSVGLGRDVSYALRSASLPGYGELGVAWGKTPPGAAGRTWLQVPLLFTRPERVPYEWFAEHYRLAQQPGFLEAMIAALRAIVDLEGQREVLLDELPRLQMPTLVVWGASDRVFPASQAREAVARLRYGALELIPDCGHLPQVERPDLFVPVLNRFFDEQSPD